MKKIDINICMTSPDDDNFGTDCSLNMALKKKMNAEEADALLGEIQSAVYRFLRKRVPDAKIDT